MVIALRIVCFWHCDSYFCFNQKFFFFLLCSFIFLSITHMQMMRSTRQQHNQKRKLRRCWHKEEHKEEHKEQHLEQQQHRNQVHEQPPIQHQRPKADRWSALLPQVLLNEITLKYLDANSIAAAFSTSKPWRVGNTKENWSVQSVRPLLVINQ